MEVGPDAVHGPWQSYASDQQNKEDHVGHGSSDVHHLNTHTEKTDERGKKKKNYTFLPTSIEPLNIV